MDRLVQEAAWLRPEPLVIRKAITDLRGAVAPKLLRDRYVYKEMYYLIYSTTIRCTMYAQRKYRSISFVHA